MTKTIYRYKTGELIVPKYGNSLMLLMEWLSFNKDLQIEHIRKSDTKFYFIINLSPIQIGRVVSYINLNL
jgi:hypothetical protein